MRYELQIIEKIEHYLDGELSPDEKAAFEQQMTGDPGLREEVRLQQDILDGIVRAGFRDKIQQAKRRYQWKHRFFKGGALGIVILSVVLVWQLWPVKGHQQVVSSRQAASTRQTASNLQAGSGQPVTNQVTPAGTAKDTIGGLGKAAVDTPAKGISPAAPLTEAEKNLPAQTFRIDALQDTVIETKGGMVLSIPAGTFQQEDGQAVTGGIELVVREALDPASIIRAGLTSLSEGQLLESGGMFSVDASKDGKALKIDPANGIYAEIPTDTVKSGMQLYTGNKLADGTIDWVKPRSLEHDLVAVDIRSLDFYPPRYLDSLRWWGYDSRDKRFTDSLYYSFAQFFAAQGVGDAPGQAVITEEEKTDTAIRDAAMPRDTAGFSPVLPCGINPAKIKAIWNEQFQNTLLATREFEERMPWIHRSENGAILDLYVKHLDKPLSAIDSIAATLLTGRKNKSLRDKFRSFYSRHDGRVKNGSRQFAKLKEYYELKERVFTEAIARTERGFRAKQAELDKVASGLAQTHAIDSIVRVDRNFSEEFALNLASVCKQLGCNEQIVRQPPARMFYRVQLNLTGWCNIDRAVAAATMQQTTVVLTDDQTGKKAVISYLNLSIQVVKPEAYDRIYVYLLPDKLSSFIRLSGSNGDFTGKLNDLMKYDLVCVAYKQEQAFYHYQATIGSGDHPSVTLDSIGKAELDRRLNLAGSMRQAADLQRENAYFRFEITDEARQKNVAKVWALQCTVMRLLFPCMLSSERACIPVY